MFICPLCGNKDKKYIGYLNSNPYCRKCIKFSNNKKLLYQAKEHQEVDINLKYPLSFFQNEISNNLVNSIKEEDNILVYAVCGAGKTEIIIKVIKEYLVKGGKVGIVIPRRDLVIELGKRIQDIFINMKVIEVYGGNTSELDADIVVLTSHQAYRYEKFFDLLIIDEIDAFPYANDEVLKSLVKRASKGKIISLSATPSDKDLSENKVYTLFKRYHNSPLPIPVIIRKNEYFLFRFLVKKIKIYLKENKYIFVYVPSIKEGHILSKKLKKYFELVYIYSSLKNKEEIMKKVRNKEYHLIITTTILERGVTYKNLQVLVYKANEYIYDKSTLIQIAGRVGRTIDCPNGDVYFLAKKVTKEMKEAVNEIKKYNAM